MFDYNHFFTNGTNYECVELNIISINNSFEYFHWYDIFDKSIPISELIPSLFNLDHTLYFEDFNGHFVTEYWITF